MKCKLLLLFTYFTVSWLIQDEWYSINKYVSKERVLEYIEEILKKPGVQKVVVEEINE